MDAFDAIRVLDNKLELLVAELRREIDAIKAGKPLQESCTHPSTVGPFDTAAGRYIRCNDCGKQLPV